MKIQRPVLNMVMLVTVLLVFVTEASVSAEVKKNKQLPDPPEILSYTVTPERIAPGATATLQWSTSNTDHVFIIERTRAQSTPEKRAVEPSGSVEIRTFQTVTYRLQAQKGGGSVSRDLTIHVTKQRRTPTATCSITGQVMGKLDWDLTDPYRGEPLQLKVKHIYMDVPGETSNWISARLQGRTYAFKNVSAGKTYRIFPNTVRSEPQERVVTCEPNQTHTGMDFEITGPPRHD